MAKKHVEYLKNTSLIDRIISDFPAVANIFLDFSEKWDYIGNFTYSEKAFIVNSMQPAPIQADVDEFLGLSPMINLQIKKYKIYTLFNVEPIVISSNIGHTQTDMLKINPDGLYDILLTPQAGLQVWFGQDVGVITGGSLKKEAAVVYGEELLTKFWKVVEIELNLSKIFAQCSLFSGVNQEKFLIELGFIPDALSEGWWVKYLIPDIQKLDL